MSWLGGLISMLLLIGLVDNATHLAVFITMMSMIGVWFVFSIGYVIRKHA
jgi:hypothetical protein